MWLIFAVASTLFFSAYDILSRILASQTINPVAYSGIYNLLVAVFALALYVVEPWGIVSEGWDIELFALFALGMLIWSVFARVEFIARKLNEVSRLMVLFRIAPVVTFIFALIFLGESATWQKVLALAMTIAANLLIVASGIRSKEQKNGFSMKGVMIGVIAAVALGLGWSFDKILSAEFSLPFYTFSAYFFPGMVTLLVPPIKSEVIQNEVKHMSIPKTALLAAIVVAGFYLYLRALAIGEASKVIIVTSSATVIAIVLGIVLLKERDDVPAKLIAGVLVLVATIILS